METSGSGTGDEVTAEVVDDVVGGTSVRVTALFGGDWEEVVDKSVVVKVAGEVEVTSSIDMAGGTDCKLECELAITLFVIDSDGPVGGNAVFEVEVTTGGKLTVTPLVTAVQSILVQSIPAKSEQSNCCDNPGRLFEKWYIPGKFQFDWVNNGPGTPLVELPSQCSSPWNKSSRLGVPGRTPNDVIMLSALSKVATDEEETLVDPDEVTGERGSLFGSVIECEDTLVDTNEVTNERGSSLGSPF